MSKKLVVFVLVLAFGTFFYNHVNRDTPAFKLQQSVVKM